MAQVKNLLKELSEAHAASGAENPVAKIVKRELSTIAKVKIDSMGNVIAHKRGKKPTVMIASHMDEIGLMVKFIDDSGYLKFAKIGGIDDRTLVSRRVVVHGKKDIPGVIGARAPHLLEKEEEGKVQKHKDMFIDIGASKKKQAEALVSIGDYATFDIGVKELAGGLLTGKCFDNRAGLTAIITALQTTKSKNDLYFVGTVQEEVGLKGARTSAFGINPDIAIAVDLCFAGDNPAVKPEEAPAKLGGGPALMYAEASGSGVIPNRNIVKWLERSAKRAGVKCQFQVSEAGMSDAAILQLTRDGIPTASVGIPSRYMHSPVEVVSVKDVEATANLLARALEKIEI